MENYRVFGNGCQYIARDFDDHNHPNSENKVQDESSHITEKIAEQQKKALIPLKEDLADWLAKLTGKLSSKFLFRIYCLLVFLSVL